MPAAIVFDTETSGLPPKHRDPARLEDWHECRLVQLAWMVLNDTDTDRFETYSAVVKPNGFVIPQSSIRIHGITQKQALEEGRDAEEVLKAFQDVLERFPGAALVAHNIEFDISIALTEAKRLNMDKLQALLTNHPQHCTMLTAVGDTRRRWPKLGDLYKEHYKMEPEGRAHDAMWDVMTCAQIYQKQALMN